jgi:hypothetical protein
MESLSIPSSRIPELAGIGTMISGNEVCALAQRLMKAAIMTVKRFLTL